MRNRTERPGNNTLQALKKSKERLRLSQQFASIGNWEWDIATGDMYWSDQIWTLFGLPAGSFEPSHEKFLEYIHPDDRNTVVRAIDDSLHHGTPFKVEHHIVWPNGRIHWLKQIGNIIRNPLGKPIRMLGLTSNIDEQKYHERERMRQLEQQCSALTREVHHRIKNNLQGIIGLLRNNLNNSASNPRIAVEKAITQIRSIAIIHDLQARRDGNEVLLCDMIPAIVEGHTLPGQGVAEIDLSLKIDRPLQLLDEEAVSIALIFNELITNALKHADRQNMHEKVSVSLQVTSGQGEISIHCPGGRLPEGFDFQTGSGYGTGLELIRALLPPDGMSIQYRQNPTGVTTDVLLQAPIVQYHTLPEQDCHP